MCQLRDEQEVALEIGDIVDVGENDVDRGFVGVGDLEHNTFGADSVDRTLVSKLNLDRRNGNVQDESVPVRS